MKAFMGGMVAIVGILVVASAYNTRNYYKYLGNK